MNLRNIISYANEEKLNQIKSHVNVDNVKSNFIFKKIIDFIKKGNHMTL